MKKLFKILLLSVSFGFVFTSCIKDEEVIQLHQLVGTWEGVSVYVDNGWIDITKYPYNTKFGFSITFYSNGTYYGEGAFGTGRGTYSVRGKVIKTYVDRELYLTYKVKEFYDDTAELTIIEDSDTMDVIVRKTS